jgi:hypothetical protein
MGMDSGERDRTTGDDPLLQPTGTDRSEPAEGVAEGAPETDRGPSPTGVDAVPAPSGNTDRLEVFGHPVAIDRRVLVLVGCIVVALALVAGGWWLTRGEHERLVPPPGEAAIDVWAPSWTIDEVLDDGTDRLDAVREFSPFWYETVGIDDIRPDGAAPSDAADTLRHAVRGRWVVPSLRDAMPAGEMAAIIADPDRRRQHIDAILDFADEHDADGIDIDYEQFAFADGFDTWETTRPNWVAFVEELSDALHDSDRTLTVSIPAIWDHNERGSEGFWVYDHAAIAPFVDAMRIMAYDYSVIEPGPVAPLWWVEDVVRSVSEVVPAEFHDRLVLGVPAYGTNWVVSTDGECPASADGRVGVTARGALDLAERRDGAPEYDPVDAEWGFTYELEFTEGDLSCVQSRQVRWVDSEGVDARVMVARDAGWDGVALWALGYDDADVWTSFVDAARRPLSTTPTTIPGATSIPTTTPPSVPPTTLAPPTSVTPTTATQVTTTDG